MALDDKSILNSKLSPLIEGQVPDFVQSDHPVFVEFLKDYYKFLEAGELTITTTTQYVSLETQSSSYVLDETDGDRIVTEFGTGTKGFFQPNETITGETSKATAQVLVDDSRNARLFISSQQKFITGETITGGTSGSEGTIVKYRGNPVQNIQQMLDYADVDNTIYDFLDKMKDSFMTDIPSDLASGVSRRDLLKNIKDLYATKGTSEGHKLFMRMLLGETADIFYPNQYMFKSSAGDWKGETKIRVLAFSNVTGEEILNQTITGETSGATATVVSSLVSQETSNNFNDSVTEFEIANVTGTFETNEIVSGISNISDRLVRFTVFGIVSQLSVESGGNLYSQNETVELENLGNNFTEIVVDEVSRGQINSVVVDDSGTEYAVGDKVIFTSNSVDVDAKSATAEVSMVGGGVALEIATIASFGDTDIENNLVLESKTTTSLVPFNIILEENREDVIVTNGTSYTFGLGGDLNADTDTLQVFLNGVQFNETEFTTDRDTARTNWTASGTNITFTDLLNAGTEIVVRATQNDFLLIDRTDIVGGVTGSGTSAVGGSDSGYKIESNSIITTPDEFDKNSRNQIVLEYDTFENLGVKSERGQIQSVRINVSEDENIGYSKLPTTTITSIEGSGAKLVLIPDNIGQVKSVKFNNNGFRYSETNPPEVNFRSHFIVKDVTGTFAENNTLTSHVGTVVSWDTTTNELVVKNFDNSQKIVQEQSGSFNEGIQLEQETELLTPVGFLLEDEKAPRPTGFSKDIFISNTQVATELSKHVNLGKGGGLPAADPLDNTVITIPPDPRYSVEDRIVLDATDVFDPYETNSNPFSKSFSIQASVERVTIKVSAQWNEVSSTWEFLLDGKKQDNLTLYEGTEYYFDLSHPSLYGLQSGTPTKFLQKSFALSLQEDGRNTNGTLGTRETSHITTTQKYNVDGQLDLIRVGLGSPNTVSWLSALNSPHYYDFSQDTNLPDHIWTPSDYSSFAKPSSFFDPNFNISQGAADQSLFGTNGAWTQDQLYSIQQGYTGGYLKINIPLGSAPAGGKYYYYSPNFDTMGGVISVKRKPKTPINVGNSIRLCAIDKEEFNFILEDGSQDREIGANIERATDKLILEDGREYVEGLVKEDYEKSILTTRKNLPGATLAQLGVSDSQYLETYYRIQTINSASTFEGYVNYINQIYEPTYFMNEKYIPPKEFWHDVHKGPLIQGKDLKAVNFVKPVKKTVNRKLSSAAEVVLGHSNYIAESPVPFFFPKKSSGKNGFLLVNSFRETDVAGFIVLDGTDANGSDAGSLLASEEFGNTLILDGTDTDSSDANSGFLLDDEIGNGNIILDATASGVDIGDDVILEETLPLNTDGISITDSSGASATICYVNTATGQSTVAATSEKTASYRSINNLVGEDLIRLQDSYYYQDYSYEVIVGQSLLTYFDELKKAVHPAGFQPFGKVSIATLVSAAVTNTAAGVSDYTGDTRTFSPILGSVLETIFSQVLQSRLQVPTTVTADGQVAIGSRDDKIVQETGVLPGDNLILDVSTEFNLVLDGIDSNSTDAGDFIVLDGTDISSTDAGERIVLLDDQASNIIMEDEVLRLELGSDNIVLDGTDEDSSNAGDNIKVNVGAGIDLEDGLATTSADTFLYEQATVTSTKDVTSGTADGGGRIMAETSFGDAGNADRVLVSERTVKIENRPLPKFERNLLLYLAETPFGSEPCGITLETGSGSLLDNIVMDGEIPFTEDAFMELERDTQIDNIILDGTDSNGTDAGDGLILETGFFLKIEDPSLGRESETFNILFEDDGNVKLEGSPFAFPFGFHVSNGSKLLLDTLDNDETILLSDISSLTFAQIRTADKIEIQGLTADEENWGGGADDDNIIMEDFGQILLNQTAEQGTDAGDYLIQETTRRNRFTLEESGTLIFEKFSTLSNVAALTLEADTQSNLHGDIIFENSLQLVESFGIKIEDNPDGIIVFDSTDSAGTGDGSRALLEDFYDKVGDNKVLLEEHNVFFNEGQIPIANYRLNSTNVITKGNVRSADISVRDTGDIALEDATDDTHGYLVINSTSGSSTNAGQNIDLEGATGITY